MRTALLIPMLVVLAAPAMAFDSDAVAGGGVTFDYLAYGSSKFNAGYFTSSWTDSQWHNPQARVLPCGGIYGYYEDRDWRSSSASETGSYYSWGVGLQGGADIFLLPQSDRLNLSLVPYLRGGIGYQNASFYNVPYYAYPGAQPVRVNLTSDSGRVEFAAGVDLRLVTLEHLEVVFGVGVDYYSAASIYISSGSGGTSVGAVGNSYSFNGTDAWARFGAGVHF